MRRIGKFQMDEEFMRGGTAQETFGIMAFVPYRAVMLRFTVRVLC